MQIGKRRTSPIDAAFLLTTATLPAIAAMGISRRGRNMHRVRRMVGITVLCAALPGCATMVNGTHEQLTITSTPSGATVEVWPTGDVVTTPGQVSVHRKGTYTLRYRLDGYQDEAIQVSRASSEDSGLDIPFVVFGPFFPFFVAVDYNMGGPFRLVPNPVHATLKTLDRSALYPRIIIQLPIDARAREAGKPVAGTEWTCDASESVSGSGAVNFVQSRLLAELRDSGVFDTVSMDTAQAGDLVLQSELIALCSYGGLRHYHTAGITALDVAVERDGQALLRGRFEHVVTDADRDDFTADLTAPPEQISRTAMRDSLHAVVRDLLTRFRAEMPPATALTPRATTGH